MSHCIACLWLLSGTQKYHHSFPTDVCFRVSESYHILSSFSLSFHPPARCLSTLTTFQFPDSLSPSTHSLWIWLHAVYKKSTDIMHSCMMYWNRAGMETQESVWISAKSASEMSDRQNTSRHTAWRFVDCRSLFARILLLESTSFLMPNASDLSTADVPWFTILCECLKLYSLPLDSVTSALFSHLLLHLNPGVKKLADAPFLSSFLLLLLECRCVTWWMA